MGFDLPHVGNSRVDEAVEVRRIMATIQHIALSHS